MTVWLILRRKGPVQVAKQDIFLVPLFFVAASVELTIALTVTIMMQLFAQLVQQGIKH